MSPILVRLPVGYKQPLASRGLVCNCYIAATTTFVQSLIVEQLHILVHSLVLYVLCSVISRTLKHAVIHTRAETQKHRQMLADCKKINTM